jgi:hypothetical protein
MLFEGTWMELGIIRLSKSSQIQKDKSLSHMWNLDLNDKCTHKYVLMYIMCIYIYNICICNTHHIENMFVIV